MSEDYKPHVGDEGTAIEVDMGEDLTTWDALKFYVKKPNSETVLLVLATVKSGGGDNNNIMQYIIGSGSGDAIVKFDVQGIFKFQPWGDNDSGWTGRGDIIEFMVYGSL